MLSERKKKFFIQLGAVILVVLAIQSFQGQGLPSPTASAAVDDLRGWAWSSNIGWVSFNCVDAGVCGSSSYRVLADSLTGGLSGYAWSSNVGWIQFDPDASSAPEAPRTAARVDNPGVPSSALSGWARALSYDVGNGGWDGWISMSGPTSGGGSYGVSISGSEFSGFAWGGDVVGWLSFYNVTRSGGSSPACSTFTASPNTIIITPGGSGETTLSWQCVDVNPGSCSIDQGIGPVAESGSKDVMLKRTTIYELSCIGSGVGTTVTTLVEVKAFTPGRIEIRP